MPSAMPYTDVHRAFLQAISQHGTMSAKQAYKAFLAICAKYHGSEEIPTEDQIPEVVATINGKLYRYDQKICFVHFDPADTDFYVFCNQTESQLDRLQNTYTESELALFRLILRELACNEENKLKPIVCLNLTSEIKSKPLSKVRAEELLEEWEKLGYFVQLAEMWYFGPKTIGEFDRYLLANYPDEMQRCKLCKESVFYGVKCDKCPDSFHKDCMKKYLKRLTACPGCKGLWSTRV
ncbi:non-structural maintenance of chromosomes element 1 homolog [Ochlerotatus camptorhynchus]|uniref:non-structural maintenance of chromosomes element 1 homolog n=1 Tax=Ochlerotatus camptorhynchus TaxID=644619 RepID=UPI0031CDBE68